jgi:hypothetical protein
MWRSTLSGCWQERPTFTTGLSPDFKRRMVRTNASYLAIGAPALDNLGVFLIWEEAMSKRKRLLLLAGLLVLLAGAGLVFVLWLTAPPRTAITREDAERIQLGMTLATVEAVLGGPARDECTGPIIYHATVIRVSHSRPEGLTNVWQSDTVQLCVVFRDDVVIYRSPLPVHRVEESLLDILRRVLGL